MSSRSAQHNSSSQLQSRLQVELDARMRLLYGKARMLVGVTSRGDLRERNRLIRALERGERVEPEREWEPVPVESRMWTLLEEARALAADSPAQFLYEQRLNRFEDELSLLEVLGQPRSVRPMAARLFGTGQDVPIGESRPLSAVAREILAEVNPDAPEDPTVPAKSETGASVSSMVRQIAQAARLHIDVRVEPGLTANAAVGERTVFLADRAYGRREALRFSVHEVLGHLVSQFNGRAQRLAIFGLGTAGSFADQEGVALYFEEQAGVMGGSRKRTIAARVIATDAMHQGARFGETARMLMREHDFGAPESIALCERAYRGGGVARDAVYLRCWLNVRRAIDLGEVSLAELQVGKVSLNDVEEIRQLRSDGLVLPSVYFPNFALSLLKTGTGTNSETSPSSRATSLTRFDAT